MEKFDLREFDLFVNLGRDCRSLNYIHSFDRLYGNQESEFFNKRMDILFDHGIFNNESYLKIFYETDFLADNINKNFRIEIYDNPEKLIDTYYKLKETQHGRVDFTCFIGRYNFIKFNNHMDDIELLCNTDVSTFEKFYKSIQDNIFPKIHNRIKKKVENFYKLRREFSLKKILFIRSEEVIDCYSKLGNLDNLQQNFKVNFYNSKLLLISNKVKTFNGIKYDNPYLDHITNINFTWGKPTDEEQFKPYFIV